jgi:threonine dehydratase
MVTVNTDEICAAIKDVFEETRTVAEPAGALAIAGLKKYVQQHNIVGPSVAIVSGANVNFDRLRHISERAEVGEAREKILGVGLEEKPGSFLKFSRNLGSRAVTEFNYRLGDATRANVYVGIEVESDIDAENLFEDLKIKGYPITDLTENEAAKVHLRHMVGGKPKTPISEAVFRFEFPERKGALLKFLKNIGNEWDITLFHYRNHGAAWGRVLVGFSVQGKPIDELRKHLVKVGYRYWEETHNEGYNLFLR